MITSKEYRAENSKNFSNTLYNKNSFNTKLDEVIESGFSFEDKLAYKREKIEIRFSNYDIELDKTQNVTEFLLRLKYRAYFYGRFVSRLCDVVLTLYFNGPRVLLRRIHEKVR